MISYYQPSIGETEKKILIEPIEIINESIDPLLYFSKYKFSNFRWGIRPLNRLIKRTIEQKINGHFLWTKDVWKDVCIININVKLIQTNSNEPFSELKFDNEEYFLNFFPTISKKRKKDIIKYSKLYKQDKYLGNPIFISGAVLNKICDKVIVEQEIYMLDGARRIAGRVLALKSEMNISLIELKNKINLHDERK